MSKKSIIISIISVIVIATIVVVVILILRGVPTKLAASSSVATTSSTSQAATSTKKNEIPINKSCSIITPTQIKTSFGKVLTSLSDSSDTDTTAINGEIADQCSYTFTTTKSDNNTLSIQAYIVSPTSPQGNPFGDPNWAVIANNKTGYPAFYKQSITDTQQLYYFVVATPSEYYLFTVTQPKDSVVIDEAASLDIMATLGNNGVYTTTK